jgi:NAD(P)-dependent dehydrogenase (short-subunit alcohol dehydrogenase family)
LSPLLSPPLADWRFRVDCRVAIVTAAGRGIGTAFAIALAEAGADVVIAARTGDQLDVVAKQIAAPGRRGTPAERSHQALTGKRRTQKTSGPALSPSGICSPVGFAAAQATITRRTGLAGRSRIAVGRLF